MILVLQRGGGTRILRQLQSVERRIIDGQQHWVIEHNQEGGGSGVIFTERYMLTYDIAMVIQVPRVDSPRVTFLLGDPRPHLPWDENHPRAKWTP